MSRTRTPKNSTNPFLSNPSPPWIKPLYDTVYICLMFCLYILYSLGLFTICWRLEKIGTKAVNILLIVFYFYFRCFKMFQPMTWNLFIFTMIPSSSTVPNSFLIFNNWHLIWKNTHITYLPKNTHVSNQYIIKNTQFEYSEEIVALQIMQLPTSKLFHFQLYHQ